MNISLADAFASFIVESMPADEALDVVAELHAGSGSPREKLTVAFDSGAAEGARRAYDVLMREANESDMEMVRAVERIDVEISQAIDPEAVHALQTVRAPMFEYLASKRSKHLDRLHALITGKSSVVTVEVLQGAELPPDEILALGVHTLSGDPATYGGFLAYGDDMTMQCRCPNCVAERWREAGNGLKEIRLITERDMKNPEAASQRMLAFGAFVVDSMRRKYQFIVAKLVRAPKPAPVADAKLAGQQAQDIMAGIMGKPKKE